MQRGGDGRRCRLHPRPVAVAAQGSIGQTAEGVVGEGLGVARISQRPRRQCAAAERAARRAARPGQPVLLVIAERLRVRAGGQRRADSTRSHRTPAPRRLIVDISNRDFSDYIPRLLQLSICHAGSFVVRFMR